MQTKSIHFVAYPKVSLLDLAGPLEVFIAANYLARCAHPPYSISIVALNEMPEVFGGFSIAPERLTPETR